MRLLVKMGGPQCIFLLVHGVTFSFIFFFNHNDQPWSKYDSYALWKQGLSIDAMNGREGKDWIIYDQTVGNMAHPSSWKSMKCLFRFPLRHQAKRKQMPSAQQQRTEDLSIEARKPRSLTTLKRK